MQRLKSFFIIFIPLYFIACSGYLLLHKITPNNYVFGALYRMFIYHIAYPFLYILIPVIIYSFLIVLFQNVLKRYEGFGRVIWILGLMGCSIIISAPVGGLLWVYHDVQAGFVPPTNVLINNLIWGVGQGLTSGLFIILISIPYNILGIVTGVFTTNYLLKKYL